MLQNAPFTCSIFTCFSAMIHNLFRKTHYMSDIQNFTVCILQNTNLEYINYDIFYLYKDS